MFSLETFFSDNKKNNELIDFTQHNLTEEFIREIPLQTLFFNLKKSSSEEVAQIFPKLLKSQRQAVLDLDLWLKDEFNQNNFSFWLTVVDSCNSQKVKLDFIKSEEMVLFLKSQFSISTFDQDDPVYPSHENFFLTPDNLLVIEYNSDFEHVDELKNLINILYQELGVDNAYAYLFKLINESYLLNLENNYQTKKSRLEDLGFVDYYDSLELLAPFRDIKFLDFSLMENKNKRLTPEVSENIFNQSVDLLILNQYKNEVSEIEKELNEIKDVKRLRFLKVNFLKFVNASLGYEMIYSESNLKIVETNIKYINLVKLGLDYIKHKFNEKSLFNYFDFFDLYKAGKTLVSINQKQLKSVYKDGDDSFIGNRVNTFLEESFLDSIKFEGNNVCDLVTYNKWSESKDFFIKLSATVFEFRKKYQKLVEDQLVLDDFYLNYDLSSVDFEALILTALSNFILGVKDNKMGITVDEFKKVLVVVIDSDTNKVKSLTDVQFSNLIDSFLTDFGLIELKQFKTYLYAVINDQLNGYDWKNLSNEEYKHVGGPILLNNLTYH